MHYLSTCITPLSGYPTCPPLLKRPSLTEIQSSSLNFSLIIIIPYPIWPPYLCKGDKLKHKSGIAVHSFILSPRNRYAPPLTCFTELTPRKLRQRLKWKNFDGGLGERTTLMISQQSYPRCDGWEIYAQAVAHVDTRACARDLEPPPCWRQLRIQFAKYSTQEFNWIFCGFATFLKRIRQRVFRGKNFWDFYIWVFKECLSWVILNFWKCEAEYASVWLRHPYWRESSFRDLPKHVKFSGEIASFYAFYLRQIREFDLSVACNLRLFLDFNFGIVLSGIFIVI